MIREAIVGSRAAFVPVVQRRLVTVMSVGNYQLLVFHRLLDRGRFLRLRAGWRMLDR